MGGFGWNVNGKILPGEDFNANVNFDCGQFAWADAITASLIGRLRVIH